MNYWTYIEHQSGWHSHAKFIGVMLLITGIIFAFKYLLNKLINLAK